MPQWLAACTDTVDEKSLLEYYRLFTKKPTHTVSMSYSMYGSAGE